MSSVWKFPLPDDSETVIRMPKGAQVLSVQMQGERPMIWALVDPQEKVVRRRFWTVGTGWDVNTDGLGTFVGTIQLASGALVFHIFDGGEVGEGLPNRGSASEGSNGE